MPPFQKNTQSPSSWLKGWHLPTSLHGDKTQNNIITTLTAVETSNSTTVECFLVGNKL
jgi:hypothetical protein